MRRLRLPAVVVDLLLVLLALAESLLYLDEATRVSAVLGTVGALGLLLRRRWPWVSLVLSLPALLLLSATVAGLVALYSVAVAERRRGALIPAAVLVFAATVPARWPASDPEQAIVFLTYAIMNIAAPIALGLLVRTRRELIARLRELERVREVERRHADDEVLATERARIAREMHDVVSHQVSLLAVQAGALQVATAAPDVEAAARTMRSLAVKTLDELRQMVGLLRATGKTRDQLAPQPTLEDLPELIRNSRIRATTTVDLSPELPASLQRAVYRTVQEGLTNVRKHAPGAHVTITARSAAGAVTVVVHNTPGTSPSMNLPSAAHGLIGLRERAELLGGSLSAHLDADGGHTLTLRIPAS